MCVQVPFHLPGHALHLETRADAEQLERTLRRMVVDSGEGCRSHALDYLDDESYLHDRSPEQLAHPNPVQPSSEAATAASPRRQ